MEPTQIMVKEICPTSTQAWIKKGATLVDVREKDEVAQLAYYVPNMINIPLSEFEARYKELPLDKDLVIVCRSGGRSLRAAGFLIYHGYDVAKVVNMKHGLVRWVQKGFAIIGDTSSVAVAGESSSCCGSGASGNKESSCCGGHKEHDSNCC
ncbi:MAG: rhodanese-like domain-containing protein [Ferruginibacter sp.]